MDAETFALSHNPAFIELINRSWASDKKRGGMSSAKVRRLLGLRAPSVKRGAKPGTR